MLKAILIIIATKSGGISVDHIEFASRTECELAKNEIRAALEQEPFTALSGQLAMECVGNGLDG